MTTNEARKLRAEAGSVKRAAKQAQMQECRFRALLEGKVQEANSRRTNNSAAPATRTLGDFRREHDQTWKIQDGLKRLFGGQVIMTDAEFREAVGGNPSRWRAAADQTEFREFRYRVGGELLWASKETIREMRKIRGEAI